MIDASNKSIDLAIFDFTSEDIKVALECAKTKGVTVRIIADSRQAKGNHLVIPSLIKVGFAVKIIHGKGRGIMHNKFAIFDKALLVTGSYKWMENAERFNYENAIFLSNPDAVRQYQTKFDKIWKSAKR